MPQQGASLETSDASYRVDTAMKCVKELEFLKRENAELKDVITKMLGGGQLPYLPLCLQEDQDFIESAVRAKAINWSDLPPKLKDDAGIACLYFEKNEMELLPGEVEFDLFDIAENDLRWFRLPYHLKINQKVLIHALRAHQGPQWKTIPFQFHSNIHLLCTALKYNKISFKDIPEYLQKNHQEIAFFGIQRNHIQGDDCSCFDHDFFKKVIGDDELNWTRLPWALQNEESFALSISRFSSVKSPEQIMERFVNIRYDRSFWRKILETQDPPVYRLVRDYMPAELRSDEDLMLDVCRLSTAAFEFVDRNLLRNIEFLKLALDQNAAVLQFLSHETQKICRDLVLKTIPSLASRNKSRRSTLDVYDVAKAICPSLWMQRDFATTWVRSGLDFRTDVLNNVQFEALTSSRQLCSLYAKSSNSLEWVKSVFKQDASFMLEVMDHRPELYLSAEGTAKADPWVMTTAFASCPKIVENHFTRLHFRGEEKEITDYLEFLESQLSPFKNYSKYILGNMLSNQSVAGTGTVLTLLNQGPETSMAYKVRLAEYIGVPTGKWLWRLQQAEKNVREVMAPWPQTLEKGNN